MQIRDSYPLITVRALAPLRDFYTRHLGFSVGFESDWFLWLKTEPAAGQAPASLGFMLDSHPSTPLGPEVFSGLGMILTFEVADAAAEARRAVQAGLPLAYPVTDEPWGQRRFMLRDPAGILIDIVEQRGA